MESSKTESVWIMIIVIALLAFLSYNQATKNNIETNYGYKVGTTGITNKPNCDSLIPQNPYQEDTGHFAGYEWGAEGKNCDGNSDSFIQGCFEYQNQENAYQYCLDRNSK